MDLFGFKKRREQKEVMVRQLQLRRIREKADRYVCDGKGHTSCHFSGIHVSSGPFAPIEYHPEILEFITTAWGDKSTFPQVVFDWMLGSYKIGIKVDEVLDDIDFLKDLATYQYNAINNHSALQTLGIEQQKEIDSWAGVTDRRG